MTHIDDWPVLRRYDHAHQLRVAMPIGGIGTGTVSLGGRGDLRDWEVVNRPSKGFAPRFGFFAIRTAPEGVTTDPTGSASPTDASGQVVSRALEGPIDLVLYEGAHGSGVRNHGLPRFRRSEFRTAYPFAQVSLEDDALPVDVRLDAFNPLVPLDADASGIPIAVLRYVVTNTGLQSLDVSIAGCLQNFVGADGVAGRPAKNRNTVRTSDSAHGVLLTSDGVDPAAEQAGTVAIAVLDETDVSTRTAWADHSWGGELLDFWDDFTSDGRVDDRESESDAPVASLVAKRTLAPGETHAFTFALGWHFPNRPDWDRQTTVGNYYTTKYGDAWDVVDKTAPELPELERRTRRFVDSFLSSQLPEVVKEAALFNLSTLRTQTCFRTPDGHFWGFEGCNDDSGCCIGNCTHVWNYEQATPFLFGSLARSLREIEFLHGTDDNGHMSFRIQLPLDNARTEGVAAADGQMGCLVKLYREWRLSGDDELLRSLWPKAKRALEFAWIEGGWDADQDGVMEGSQHNTMDVEYFGPNPQMAGWYLAALRAGEEMARYLGEDEFADTCANLFQRGRTWVDANLFNGEYYRHEIRPPMTEDSIAPGLRLPGIGARDLVEPELQLGDGCLVDQLVGQFLAHIAGLGHVLDPEHVRTTLLSIVRHNGKESFADHFNSMRSYVLGDEKALLMASYPNGNRPARPFPYALEVMTGMEYTAAVGLLYEGQRAEGLDVISAIRERYDGQRRNPFDEAECGHHYVRAMASWGAVPALTGFAYDGVDRSIRFAAATESTTWFWSNGYAWGTVTQTPSAEGVSVDLEVVEGELTFDRLALTGVGEVEGGGSTVLGAGQSERLYLTR